MKNLISNIKAAFSVAREESRREEGQGAFEWILLIGVVVVAVIAAVAAGFPGTVIDLIITNTTNAITGLFS